VFNHVLAAQPALCVDAQFDIWTCCWCFVMLRSAFLGTLENPEPPYTLECSSPVVDRERIGLREVT
jgi:hypothetical protein